MKRAFFIALVVVVILTGLPLVVGMPGMSCPDCGSATVTGSACAVLVAALGLFIAMTFEQLRARRPPGLGRLHVTTVERPPRLA